MVKQVDCLVKLMALTSLWLCRLVLVPHKVVERPRLSSLWTIFSKNRAGSLKRNGESVGLTILHEVEWEIVLSRESLNCLCEFNLQEFGDYIHR